MRTLTPLRWGLILALTSSASAMASPKRPDKPVTERGRQVRAPAETTKAFARLRERTQRPLRPGFRLARGSAKPVQAQGILHNYEDGLATLKVPITEAQKKVLRRVGAKEVNSEAQVRHHVIFQGHYYRELSIAPAPGVMCAGCSDDRLTGPDPRLLVRRVGRAVSLVLQRDRDGRTWVIGIETMTASPRRSSGGFAPRFGVLTNHRWATVNSSWRPT